MQLQTVLVMLPTTSCAISKNIFKSVISYALFRAPLPFQCTRIIFQLKKVKTRNGLHFQIFHTYVPLYFNVFLMLI